MPVIEIQFPVLGAEIRSDHGYGLYGAISRYVPKVHSEEISLRVGPIRGTYIGNGMLTLDRRFSRLRVRLQPDQLPALLPLAGKLLAIGEQRIRVGIPQVSALAPATSLCARLVTIKGFTEPSLFLDAAKRQLDALGVLGEASLPLMPSGPHEGKPYRRVLRVHEKRVVGFAVLVAGLSADDSLKLQESGIGGRSKMGCGFFVPMKRGS